MASRFMILNIFLTVLLAFLLISLVKIWSSGQIPSTPLSEAKSNSDWQLDQAPEDLNRSSAAYKVVAEKDLFIPDRKAPEEGKEEEKVAEGELKPPEMQLTGIIYGENIRIAVMSTPSKGQQRNVSRRKDPAQDKEEEKEKDHYYHIGDQVGGFEIVEIEEKYVTLKKGSQTSQIWLKGEKDTSAPQVATQPGQEPAKDLEQKIPPHSLNVSGQSAFPPTTPPPQNPARRPQRPVPFNVSGAPAQPEEGQ